MRPPAQIAPWDEAFDRRAVALLGEVCGHSSDAARLAAWQGLLIEVAPHVESWLSGSRLLRRCRMSGEDDIRAVLVAVFERMARNGHENLRDFLDKRGGTDSPLAAEERATLDRLTRIGAWLDDTEAEPPAPPGPADTPLRAWLLTLSGYCERDHVRQRLGWSRDGPTRRDLGTDAARLSGLPTLATRPRMTDILTLRGLFDRVEALASGFPPPMAEALRRWSEDESFEEIARELGLADADAARRLVRAAQARLRARFRGEWDGVFA